MTAYEKVKKDLQSSPKKWLVTGAAGFIGSALVESLLRLGQHVTGLDNFVTGYQKNLDDISAKVGADSWKRFRFIEGDIIERAICANACAEHDIVLHQAALGSVPRSIEEPAKSHDANVNGFFNMLDGARTAGIKRFVYASSSSVYGDSEELPKVEAKIGEVLSPYAATKRIDEVYAMVYGRSYDIKTAGLRYFNVFGPRQDPAGAYAAVIPAWIAAMLRGEQCHINGDGSISRDFCYIDNVVQANILAATVETKNALNTVYNIACGERTTLNELHAAIKSALSKALGKEFNDPKYGPVRAGDILHSLADISKAVSLLGYSPTHTLSQGLDEAIGWYVRSLS